MQEHIVLTFFEFKPTIIVKICQITTHTKVHFLKGVYQLNSEIANENKQHKKKEQEQEKKIQESKKSIYPNNKKPIT